MKYTITEALHEMRRLQGADAGRLRGVEVRHHLDELTDLDRLPAPWGSRLVALIEARQGRLHHRRHPALPGLLRLMPRAA